MFTPRPFPQVVLLESSFCSVSEKCSKGVKLMIVIIILNGY